MKLVCQTDIPAKCRITKAVVAGGLFFGFLVLFLVPPVQLPLPVCLFHSIIGHSCLTCGMTRSLHALLHGDLAASAEAAAEKAQQALTSFPSNETKKDLVSET